MSGQIDADGEPIEIDPADLPPALQWEQGVYDIYQIKRTQWFYTMVGRVALNYDAFEKIAEARGYDMELFAGLLRCIEYAEMRHDHEAREQEQQKRGR